MIHYILSTPLHNIDSTEYVWKVARNTSAAPFYFKSSGDYVDGGMMANNPCKKALRIISRDLHHSDPSMRVSLVVSVGTGLAPSERVKAFNVNCLECICCFRNLLRAGFDRVSMGHGIL